MKIAQRIDPVTTAEDIQENYLSFLMSSFSLRNPELADQFKGKLRESLNLFKGPILQANPHYRSSISLADLALTPDNGVSDAFLNFAPGLDQAVQAKHLPIHRPLYIHQQQALLKAAAGQNIIVATGTGSGKTEAFLLPIINHLLTERQKKGLLSPGVRALLIYPMNALANDQIKRLREMLPPETGITFGRYTGQTKRAYHDAHSDYMAENHREPAENELISREQIQEKPPHILLTNYAMLEYLLMRPEDAEIFTQGKTWQFLVLDEAHSYRGAMGSEIGYLMRKVKDRVAGAQAERIQCIATSATIGDESSPDVKEQVCASVSRLFGAEFKPENMIFADKVPAAERFAHSSWGRGSIVFYELLMSVLETDNQQLQSFCHDILCQLSEQAQTPGFPEAEVIESAVNTVSEFSADELRSNFLFELLKGDERIRSLAYLLEQQPASIHELSAEIFDDLPGEEQSALIKLIDLGTQAHDPLSGVPLIMARYHFFVRSMEGLSISFPGADKQNLKIGRFSQDLDHGKSIVAFELKGCRRCGATYLNGRIQSRDAKSYLVSYPPQTTLDTQDQLDAVYSIDLKHAVETSEDEYALAENERQDVDNLSQQPASSGTAMNEPQFLCLHCSCLHDYDTPTCCDSPRLHEVCRIMPTGQGKHRVIKTCPACGSQRKNGSIIYSFRTNENEAAFMLGRTLFQHIPRTVETTEKEAQAAQAMVSENPFAAAQPVTSHAQDVNTTGKKRLLAFSDSRMDASFFASYMQQQANKVLHRQLIYAALREIELENPEQQGFGIEDLHELVLKSAVQAGLFERGDYSQRKEVAKWLYAELCGVQPRRSLEGVGLITWRLDPVYISEIRRLYPFANEQFEKFGLTEMGLIQMLEQWLAYLRKRSVVKSLKHQINYTDTYFWPRNRPYSLAQTMAVPLWSVASWQAEKPNVNGRLDYLRKLWERQGKQSFDYSEASDCLELIWKLLMQLQQSHQLFISSQLEELWVDNIGAKRAQIGSVFQLNPRIWRASTCFAEDETYGSYRCSMCGYLSHVNHDGICPTYRCKGTLESFFPSEKMSQDYYRRLYLSEKHHAIHILEHTAQITTREGSLRQKHFIDDHQRLNMLSCSTTFELGVDVGQLHAVFLRNVPPGIANYVQRAGRAARRLDATAFILTFCRARSHDLAYFEDALKLVNGTVDAPYIPENNLDIARRHLHSVVFERFFKNYPEYYNGPESKHRGQVRWLFFTAPGQDICTQMNRWLEERPPELQAALKRVFSREVALLGIDNWQWHYHLVHSAEQSPEAEAEGAAADMNISDGSTDDTASLASVAADEADSSGLQLTPEQRSFLSWEGVLGRAQAELYEEHLMYSSLVEDPKRASMAGHQLKRICEIRDLDYLPTRGVLPKYGFPVDVVSLHMHSTEPWAQQIQLQRDLRMAISEFAPGCQLVANGRVIKSYGIQKVFNKRWPEYSFMICAGCGRFERSQAAHEKTSSRCSCGNYKSFKSGRFIIPQFGFTTSVDDEASEPVDSPPERTFSTQVYFSSYQKSPEVVPYAENKEQGLSLHTGYSQEGKLVVINDNNGTKFHICRSCGYGLRIPPKAEQPHNTPYGRECPNKDRFSSLALGHEFKTDVLELRISGSRLGHYKGQDLWLSVLAALVRGACKALKLEEENLDGTLGNFSGGQYRSIFLYDTFPGGAGFVKQVREHLKKVIFTALDIAESCASCSEDQSCNGCLRRYQNQYAHPLLKRGQAAAFLRDLYTQIDTEQSDGFYPPGQARSNEWLYHQLMLSRESDLILQYYPNYAYKFRYWLEHLLRVEQQGCSLNLYLADPEQNLFSPEKALESQFLFLLAQRGIKIYTFQHSFDLPAQALFHTGDGYVLGRWSKEEDSPFTAPEDYSLRKRSCLETDTLVHAFKKALTSSAMKLWSAQEIQARLQTVQFISLRNGVSTSWAEILNEYLPVTIRSVTIYDRYIRREQAFESLCDFLNMLQIRAETSQSQIDVSIQTSYGSYKRAEELPGREQDKAVRERKMQETQFFPSLRSQSEAGGSLSQLNFVSLTTLHKQDTASHQRKIEMTSSEGWKLEIKLEKGFDILYKPRNRDNFLVSEESYLILRKIE